MRLSKVHVWQARRVTTSQNAIAHFDAGKINVVARFLRDQTLPPCVQGHEIKLHRSNLSYMFANRRGRTGFSFPTSLFREKNLP
jgi:hypothetical protein